MSVTYEVGGIFQAIQNTIQSSSKKETKTDDEIEDDTGDAKTLLTSLFSQQIAEQPKSFLEEDIKEYINKDLFHYDSDENKGLEHKDNNTDDDENQTNSNKVKKKKKKKQKEDPERIARTVFVGNVSVNVTRKSLKKIFNQFGEIETIRIRSVPTADPKIPKKVALIKKEFHTERDNMTAYVVFKSEESANKSLKCNGTILEGLHIRVDKSDNKQHDHKCCIFVGNLPFGCAEEAIRNHFKDCGPVVDVRLIRDKNTGLGKGFGYIKFKSPDGVMFGLKMNGSTFDGRKLRVYRSKENPTQNKPVRNKDQRKFGGLRVTSMKDMEKGKKLFGSTKNSKTSNAMRRIKNKNLNQKQTRNKERNLNRKSKKVVK